ncbi:MULTISPECIES: bifunctional pyr operon transcriptional regulator/uracil phosphoribosyltransferase PyrR [Corynebacterium]|jgi:pyrimidine operon attenuation protein/uracil phosphoribosyltransferase|uniref:Bifunctional protein PyrR n=1 Tax=Corynebacterium provencense TaxID=1737425 RepID=A0A2Z3YPV0_9CORY|nr:MULTISPECIES: bifunctional pyr operon transcriptional regulator/uracil phosphoribosyltransferase PyrR [Corynebacterium]AWT26139.1 Bifunctional protein PyrR [Corynebacterium provencense]MCI1256836.1 bifunctional pyr operon transcriptional regulator/uracil phosphoribosyltransferase PyrR [Corynebacterium provencense]
MNTNAADDNTSVVLMDNDDVGRTIARIAHQIIEKTALDSPGADRVVLLGIPSGGVPLAARLAARIRDFSGVTVFHGALDVTLYRDDLKKSPHRALQSTTVPREGIEGATVVLVDDVLFSGRTIRSALDALRDIGRARRVQLAVLVDRGHRELPIRADYVGKNIPTALTEDVCVDLAEIDGADGVRLLRPAAPEGDGGTAE